MIDSYTAQEEKMIKVELAWSNKCDSIQSKLDALVKASEDYAPKCFHCGKPCWTYVDEMGSYCSITCYNEANGDDMQQQSDSLETDEYAQSLWTAIQNAKEPS